MITNETDEKKTKLITLVSKKTNLSRKDFSIMKPEIRSLDTAERTLLKDSDAFLTAETSQTKKTSFELIKPFLWILIGLPIAIFAILIFFVIIYCKKSCKLRSYISFCNKSQIPLQNEMNNSVSRTIVDYREQNTPPPFYSDVVKTKALENKGIETFSVEMLPNYSSWCTKSSSKYIEVF